MPQAGLNIATQAGEGAAPVLHWDMFNATVQNIYQRNLYNQKMIANEYQKLNFSINDASKGIRPADMPKYKENYKRFQQAGIMLQSPKIRNNPTEQAFWSSQMEQAHLDNMSLAKQSEDAQQFLHDTWADIAKNPEKYYPHDELMQRNAIYNASPVDMLNKMGMNTAVPWMHPADAYPQEQFDKHVLGDPKTVPGPQEKIYDSQGKEMGWNNTSQEIYAKKPAQIAADVGQGMQQVWSVSKQWQQKYSNDVKQQPEVVKTTIDKAQEIIDADKSNGGYKLDKGYVGYAAASYILRSQPSIVGARSFQESPEYKSDLDKAKQQDQQDFEMGKLRKAHDYRVGEIQFRQSMKEAGLKFSGGEMYSAAMKPYVMFAPQDAKKGDAPIYGFQLLDKRMSDVMSKAPKNLDYVILTKYDINNTEQRRRLIDKLFGGIDINGASPQSKLKKDLYDLNRQTNTEDNMKNFISLLNYSKIPLNENDLNNYAIPVIVDKIKQAPVSMINPATHSYDQFVQQLSQILNSEKPKGDVEDDFTGDQIGALNNYINPQ
jgi:hypothetical protein